MVIRPRLAVLICLFALVVATGSAADRNPAPDPTLYRGAHRLSAGELQDFLDHWGHYYRPGMRLPLWAERWVDRYRAGFSSPAKATGQGAGLNSTPNVDVSRDPSKVHSESFIAVDRSNPMRLVGGSNQINDNPQMMFWSNDGGNTWGSVPMALGSASFHSDPGVAWDSKGVAHGSALGIVGATETQIQVVRSTDGGQSWSSPPTSVHAAAGNDKELLAANDQPGTACQDLVCVAWDEIGRTTSDLHVACAPEGQGAWTDRIVAQGDLIGAIPAFGPDGELYVAWSNIGATSLDFVRSDDCGQTYSAAAPLAQTRVGYDLGIPAMCSRRALVYPAIDVDRSASPRRGWVYAVWNDAEPGKNCTQASCSGCNTSVYFTRSPDGGLSWSPPEVVHEDLLDTDQFNPWLAVNDSDGSLNVMWYDTRGDATRRTTNVWFRRSPDGGTNWEPEVQVTTASTDETGGGADLSNQYGDYNGIAAFQCGAWPIWTDRRSGGSEQIYASPIAIGPGVGSPGDIGNTLMGVAGTSRLPDFSWRDVGLAESDYRVYRGTAKDFNASPPSLLGTSGGGDVLTYSDTTAPATDGVYFYKVRPVGPCGEEDVIW